MRDVEKRRWISGTRPLLKMCVMCGRTVDIDEGTTSHFILDVNGEKVGKGEMIKFALLYVIKRGN